MMKEQNSKFTRRIIKLNEFDFKLFNKQELLKNNADAIYGNELLITLVMKITELESDLTEAKILEE